MIDYVREILQAQFEASLCMLRQCIQVCPPEHWECRIGNGTFRWVAYHTLFFTDLYLSPSESTFQVRDLHRRGGDEREPGPSAGLSRDETLAYTTLCRQKAIDVLAVETPESLRAASGFSWVPISRGELYLYSIRHIQHHAGQLSACLRRLDPQREQAQALAWVHSGWR